MLDSVHIYILFVCFVLRVPGSGDNRRKWITAIEKHQQFDYNRQIFNICKRHFRASDLSQERKKVVLISDAVPSVFENSLAFVDVDQADSMEYQIIGDGIIDDAIQANNQCVQCPFLKQKVADLKKQILDLTIQHDITVQKLQRKLNLLENKNEHKTEQVKQFRGELSREKKQNVRLKDVITELRDQNFISTEDENILNVCFFPFIHICNAKISFVNIYQFLRCSKCRKLLIAYVKVSNIESHIHQACVHFACPFTT